MTDEDFEDLLKRLDRSGRKPKTPDELRACYDAQLAWIEKQNFMAPYASAREAALDVLHEFIQMKRAAVKG